MIQNQTKPTMKMNFLLSSLGVGRRKKKATVIPKPFVNGKHGGTLLPLPGGALARKGSCKLTRPPSKRVMEKWHHNPSSQQPSPHSLGLSLSSAALSGHSAPEDGRSSQMFGEKHRSRAKSPSPSSGGEGGACRSLADRVQ